jgi:uncharacterized membrane protein
MPLPPVPVETEIATVRTVSTKQPTEDAVPHDPVGLHELHSTESRFRNRLPILWWITLVGPFLLSAVLLGVLWLYAGPAFAQRLVVNSALSMYVLGRFVILAGAEGSLLDTTGAMTSGQLFLLVTYLDVMVALVLAFHIGFLFRIPVVGKRFLSLVTDGHFILDAHPWIRRATFLGVSAFVCFPLTATGSVGGSIFGRLLGMSRIATLGGIMVGSLIGNGVMFFFSESLAQLLDKEHPVFKYGGFVIIAGIALLLEHRYRYLKKKYHSENEQNGDSNVAVGSEGKHDQ